MELELLSTLHREACLADGGLKETETSLTQPVNLIIHEKYHYCWESWLVKNNSFNNCFQSNNLRSGWVFLARLNLNFYEIRQNLTRPD